MEPCPKSRFVHTRRLALGIMMALISAGIGPLRSPGHAAAATTTVLAQMTGTATMETFPCILGGGCPAGFAADAVVTVSGVDVVGGVYTAIWPDPTPGFTVVQDFNAGFLAEDGCLPLIPLSPTGNAGGSFTLHDGLVVDSASGVMHHATITGGFGWIRAGLTVVVSTWATTLSVGSSTIASGGVLEGQGGGTFAPLNGPGTCTGPQTNQTALIAGVELLPV